MKMTEVSTTGPSKSSWTCASGFKASYRVVPVELLEPHLNPIDGTLKDFHFPVRSSGFSFGFHSRRTRANPRVHLDILYARTDTGDKSKVPPRSHKESLSELKDPCVRDQGLLCEQRPKQEEGDPRGCPVTKQTAAGLGSTDKVLYPHDVVWTRNLPSMSSLNESVSAGLSWLEFCSPEVASRWNKSKLRDPGYNETETTEGNGSPTSDVK
ncbi:hypothetical protein DKX38_030051 (mitochondrion) [Salix brachista]|uniref:Uncharacterized protein n=2 Tax=Salix TaxID=40685 RepID=A0A5N5IXV3_9ROSI|nr:hypothetical protein DKX38_030051 [Salix brachista]KAF9660776.1 hypothetical protein SADUNF_SadunfMtG0009600 [Salix dunnii]